MITDRKVKASPSKQLALDRFREHVSSAKAKFFQKYEMNFVMGRREGPYMWDLDDAKCLFNLHCNGGVFNLGHRNPELIELLKRSLDEFDIGNHHLMSQTRADLAHLLAEMMPGNLEYTVFGVSGGEAVDLALKVARAFTGRTKIISALGGYHGHTGLAMAAGDVKYRKPFGPQAPGFLQVPFGDIDALRSHTDRDTAAIILETIPATLGVVIPSRAYIKSVRELCSRMGVILILDEIQTGLGRTGKLWAFEHFEIIPDIVVLGKGLSGGLYPISATVMRKPLGSVFQADPFIHVSTFGGAEIGCTLAGHVLEQSSKAEFLTNVLRLGKRFAEAVEVLRQTHGRYLKGLRQMGLMMGLELEDELAGPLLTKTAYDNDLLMVYANNDTSVCQLLPPLVMDMAQVDWVAERLGRALAAARRLKPLLKIKRRLGNIIGKVKP